MYSGNPKLRPILFVCVCMSLSFLSPGCGSLGERTIERTVEKLIEAENKAIESGMDADQEEDVEPRLARESGQLSFGSVGRQTGGTYDWPSDIPVYVPQFDGDITSLGRDEAEGRVAFSIYYENIRDAEIGSYENQLKARKWNVFLKQEMGSGWMLHANHEENGDLIVTMNTEDRTGLLYLGIQK